MSDGVCTYWVVVITLPTDALEFLELTHGRCSLDVLEGHLLVFTEVDNATKVEVETFSCSVLLEKVNDSSGSEKVRILLRNVDDGLQILADVNFQHLIKTLQREIDGQTAEIVCEKFLISRQHVPAVAKQMKLTSGILSV